MPQSEVEMREAQVVQSGELLEGVLAQPGWTIIKGYIEKYRNPKRLKIKEKHSAISSLSVQNHVSGQIDILDRLMDMIVNTIERKNAVVAKRQKTTSPE